VNHPGKDGGNPQVTSVPLTDLFEAMNCMEDEGGNPHQTFLHNQMHEIVCQSLRRGTLRTLLAQAFSGRKWCTLFEEIDGRKRLSLAEDQNPPPQSEAENEPKSHKAQCMGSSALICPTLEPSL